MTRTHHFVDKHSIIGGMLIGFLMFFVAQTAASIPVVVEMFSSGISSEPSAGFLDVIAPILATALVMWLYKRWFRPEFKGVVRAEGCKEGLLLLSPLAIDWLLSGLTMNIDHTFQIQGNHHDSDFDIRHGSLCRGTWFSSWSHVHHASQYESTGKACKDLHYQRDCLWLDPFDKRHRGSESCVNACAGYRGSLYGHIFCGSIPPYRQYSPAHDCPCSA